MQETFVINHGGIGDLGSFLFIHLVGCSPIKFEGSSGVRAETWIRHKSATNARTRTEAKEQQLGRDIMTTAAGRVVRCRLG